MSDSGRCHFENNSKNGSALNPTWSVSDTIIGPTIEKGAIDVNRLLYALLAHARSNIAYVIIIIISDDSANPCLFQQCASNVNDLAYVTGA